MRPTIHCAHLASLLCLLAALALPGGAQTGPRNAWPLDTHWRFALLESPDAPALPGFDDSSWEAVTLPHTWNRFDGQDGGQDYHRGTGWYRSWFRVPAQARSRRLLLEFDGACKATEVFVNGRRVGGHVGSFARFRFDLTGLVDPSRANLLAVRVNNAPSDFIPRDGDFTQFGGLYRQVRLLSTDPVHIATMDLASPGVELVQRHVDPQQAEVEARVELANQLEHPQRVELRVTLQTPEGHRVVGASLRLSLAACSARNASLPLHIPHPHLWNAPDDPYLYRAVVELWADGRCLDALEQPLGLRFFSVRADTGFQLNGRHLGLHGVSRHQDRIDRGWAISQADQRQDFQIIQEVGANTVRLAHYQHDQVFYDLCDAHGMVVWAELCFVNQPPVTPQGRENARRQLLELIRQNFNHPSIFFWSIGNETSENRPEAAALLRELNALVHREDPGRLTVYASHHPAESPRNFITDLLAVNKYMGWYTGTAADFGPWMDRFHQDHPDRCLAVSEYGAGGSIYQHQEAPQARPAGPWHPEEGQTRVHEEHWLQIKARPYIWASYVWNMFDFAADNRNEGDQAGRNDKGLVTYDRRTRKDAFYWYQANWTKRPMVHIVSARFTSRSPGKAEIRVYSNAPEVEVSLAGTSLGRKASGDCRFVWPDGALQPGPNRIVATAYRRGKPLATDSACWTTQEQGDWLPRSRARDLHPAPPDERQAWRKVEEVRRLQE